MICTMIARLMQDAPLIRDTRRRRNPGPDQDPLPSGPAP
jgi:hypothetical protein